YQLLPRGIPALGRRQSGRGPASTATRLVAAAGRGRPARNEPLGAGPRHVLRGYTRSVPRRAAASPHVPPTPRPALPGFPIPRGTSAERSERHISMTSPSMLSESAPAGPRRRPQDPLATTV